LEKVGARSYRLCIGFIMLLIISSSLIHCVSAAENTPSQITSDFSFDPTWDLDLSDSFSGNLGAMGFGVSFSFAYSFDAGICLPVILSVEHPEYVLPDTNATASVSAIGDDSARAWAYASGGFHASLDAGLAGSFSLVDRSINMGDEVQFTTPLGSQETQTIVADVALGSQTIDLILVSYTIELRLSITTAVTAATSVSSQISMTGDALTQDVDEFIEWSEENQPFSIPFSVGDQEGTYVDMSFDDVTLYLQSLIFTVVSFTVYLTIDGATLASISIPMPGLDFIIAEEGSFVDDEDGSHEMLADASGSMRDLGSRELSIYVGVPFILPSFLSPGFFLMVIPTAIGIAYGRKKENGSKALGSALLVTVLFGAALSLGFSLTSQTGIDSFIVSWISLIIPVFNFTGDFMTFFLTYLPWMLGGLAIGGATKRPLTGAAMGFGIPFTMFLITGYLIAGFGGLMAMLSIEAAHNMVVAGAITAIVGAAGGAICRTPDN